MSAARFGFAAASFILFSLLTTSCFTGIESTKKIELSRSELRRIRLTPEDTLLSRISSNAVSALRAGHQFRITDPRIALFTEIYSSAPTDTFLQGRTVRFDGLLTRLTPTNDMERVIQFSDGDWIMTYSLGKSPEAADSLPASRLPMLIDMNMVTQARDILSGLKVWTRTSLAYDSAGTRIRTLKFAPALIEEVQPNDGVFPLRLCLAPLPLSSFSDNRALAKRDTTPIYAYLNFGTGRGESRSFSSLFYLHDPRMQHGNISDAVWRNIMNERVAAGMTKEECRLALGNPSEVEAGHDYSRLLDIWIYPDGSFLRFVDGVLVDFRQ